MVQGSRDLQQFGAAADECAKRPGRYRQGSRQPSMPNTHMKAAMENNALNPPTDSVNAQGNTLGSAGPAWGVRDETREPGRGSQTGDDDASIRRAREDTDTFGRRGVDTTQVHLQDAKAAASATVQAGKSHAKDAVNSAGKKIDSMKAQAAGLKQRSLQFAADEPMKTVAYAAAGGAALTAVLMTLGRGRR